MLFFLLCTSKAYWLNKFSGRLAHVALNMLATRPFNPPPSFLLGRLCGSIGGSRGERERMDGWMDGAKKKRRKKKESCLMSVAINS